jgi:hypothetical protein
VAQDYAQAMDATGFSYSTVRNDAYVAEHVKVSRRRDTLSWSHHGEVAQLEPEEQDHWLAQAEHVKVWRRRQTLSWSHHGEQN